MYPAEIAKQSRLAVDPKSKIVGLAICCLAGSEWLELDHRAAELCGLVCVHSISPIYERNIAIMMDDGPLDAQIGMRDAGCGMRGAVCYLFFDVL